jgi:PD-(D/E)XK nuclease superfamily
MTALKPIEFPRAIDSTMRAEFIACPRKFYWSFGRKLGPREPSADLHAGGAYAKGLETIREAFYYHKLPFAEAFEKGVLATIEYWGDYEPPEHKQQKNLERVLGALSYYFEQWPVESDYVKPYQWEGGHGVEFTFSMPMEIAHPQTGEPLLYCGRSDMIAEYQGQLWVEDDKTTSQLGPTWAQKWDLRAQFTGYCKAARDFGLPVAGAIIRGLSFLKPTKTNPSGFGHAEAITARPQWMIDQWWEQLHYDTERMIESWEAGRWDQDLSDSCVAFSACPFTRLCLTPEPEGWIEGNYATRNWDPLAKDPVGKPESQPLVPAEIVEIPR